MAINLVGKLAKTGIFKSLEAQASVDPIKMGMGLLVVCASTALTTIASNLTKDGVNKLMDKMDKDSNKVKQAEEFVNNKESEESED